MSSASDMVDFIAAGPSPYHCAAEAARRLDAAGFTETTAGAEPTPMAPGSRTYVRRGGTLVAWIAGTEAPAEAGFRIVGAHTDSPNLRLKPIPEFSSQGYLQWGVEPYGGVLLATWADRDLGLSGRIALRDGDGIETRLVRIDRPIARVANVAIHLNREVNDKGLVLNKQKHLPPMIAMAPEVEGPGLLEGLLAETADCDAGDILGWDLGLHHVHPPTVGGLDDSFVFSPRLDNQASCYTALEGLTAMEEPGAATALIVLFDHEEVGSGSEVGACSTFLRNLLTRIERDHTERVPGGVERAVANSYMVSADMAHGVHPNYADLHDTHHKPMMNAGPVIKVNVNQRYASEAETIARFRAACAAEDVPCQQFVNRSDLGCGSTIGPLSAAAVAIKTVDVGCAMLSMHSIREQCGAHDVEMMARVKARILAGG